MENNDNKVEYYLHDEFVKGNSSPEDEAGTSTEVERSEMSPVKKEEPDDSLLPVSKNQEETKSSSEEENKKDSPKAKKKKDRKFLRVENELEALFAGVGDNNKPKQEKVKKEKNHKKEKLTKKSGKIFKKISEQEKLLEKYKGPFVRLRGNLDSPFWCNVINNPYDSIGQKSKAVAGITEDQRNKGIYPQNSYSLKPDPKKPPDDFWLCFFCKNKPHFQGLGDLFGPYMVPSVIIDVDVRNNKKSKSDVESPIPKKRKRKKSENNSQVEVWFHEDCLCWMQELQIVGHHILGLEYALQEAGRVKCKICGSNGSTLCCSHLGCQQVSHFPCAKSAKWKLDETAFQAFCLQHSH